MKRFWMKALSIILISVIAWSGLLLSSQAHPANPTQEVEALFQQAFAATQQGHWPDAETLWTEIIDRFPDNAAAWSNRGNVRVRQNQLAAAIADYDKAIELAPQVPDPYLNRGAAREGLGEWDAAIADYDRVLAVDPNDAAAYNNRGNAKAGLGQWDAAIADYHRATELAPNYPLAFTNYAIALYQVGQTTESTRLLRNLVRKYPTFVDARAALTAALWAAGQQGEAESQWVSVVGLDSRYKNLTWVKEMRRWPPAMTTALEKFLKLQG